MSCLKIKLEQKNFPLSIIPKLIKCLVKLVTSVKTLDVCINNITPMFKTHTFKVSTDIEVSVIKLCTVGKYDGWEVFLVKEGIFLLSDGKTFKVIRDGISK